MHVAHHFRDRMKFRVQTLFQNTIFRYLFAIAMAGSMYAVRIWLIPFAGIGALFVLFFAPVLVTSLFAGVGPGTCATLLGVPLVAYTFAVGAGYPLSQAVFQSLLFCIDGIVIVYLTFLMSQGRQAVQEVNRQLSESGEKYRALFDSIDEGFCVFEVLFDDAENAVDCRILEVNRVFEKQTGISNPVGRRMREIAPAMEEYWLQIYGQIARTGESRRFENLARAVDRFYDVYAFRIGRPEQRQVAILFEDITTRKQTEEGLRRTQALNQAVLGSLAANIAVLDKEGNIIAVNKAWKRFAYENDGAAVAESAGVNYLQVCSNALDSRDEGRAALNGIQAVLDGTLHDFALEYACHSPNKNRWFLMSVTPLLGEQGGAVVCHTDITKRKEIEEALQESEKRLGLAMEAGGIGTFDWDIRTNAVVWTERSKTALARDPGGSRGAYDDWAKRVRPEDLMVCEAGIQEVLRTKQDHWQAEYRMTGLDTTEERWIHCQGHIFYDAQREPLRMIGVNIDISERKRIEEELRAANAFLDASIENIPLMLFIKECETLRFIRLNRHGEDLLGWPKETLIGKNDYDFWPKEEAEFFIEKDREALKSSGVVDIPEELILTRYRGVRILHTKKVPILDTNGKPIYLLGISEDITERRRIEKEQQFLAEVSLGLSASLEYEQTLANLSRLVVQNIADWCAVDVINEEGQLSRLTVASADPAKTALCAVLEQMPPDRDLPHLMRSVIESKRPIVVEQVTLQYIESLGQGPAHLQALLATGVTSFVAVPLLMRGQPVGALFIGSSTLSRVIGQSDVRLAEELADRAAMAIENVRLYRASVRAIQLRDQVLSFVAHDLRNPLSNILMQADLLERHGAAPEGRSTKPVEVIHRAVTRMNRLIQDLLDVALMEAGQLTIDRSRLSAGGLIAEAVDVQRPLASSFSLELRTEVDANVAEVWGDRDRLFQVFE